MARDHYVPQFYLSGFLNPERQRFFAYFKSGATPKETTTRAVCATSDAWSKETETMLNEKIETPGNHVLRKIRNMQPITGDDKFVLGHYMFNLVKRGPKGRARFDMMTPVLWQEAIARLRQEIERLKESDPSKSDLAEKWTGKMDTLDFSDIENDPKIMEMALDPIYANEVAEVIARMRWSLFVAEKGKGFCTSDNPVLTTRGIKPPNGQIYFPISKHIALLAGWDRNEPLGYAPALEKFVKQVNPLIVENSIKYVLYPTLTNWLMTMIRNQNRKVGRTQRENS